MTTTTAVTKDWYHPSTMQTVMTLIGVDRATAMVHKIVAERNDFDSKKFDKHIVNNQHKLCYS